MQCKVSHDRVRYKNDGAETRKKYPKLCARDPKSTPIERVMLNGTLLKKYQVNFRYGYIIPVPSCCLLCNNYVHISGN